jgi:solute carrier family 25 phosphate transporter 23/24/25/41
VLGNGINIAKVMPESAIKFGCFEAMKRITARAEGHNNPKKINNFSKIISGGAAGVVSQYVSFLATRQC